jgi:hypothetical protein
MLVEVVVEVPAEYLVLVEQVVVAMVPHPEPVTQELQTQVAVAGVVMLVAALMVELGVLA